MTTVTIANYCAYIYNIWEMASGLFAQWEKGGPHDNTVVATGKA